MKTGEGGQVAALLLRGCWHNNEVAVLFQRLARVMQAVPTSPDATFYSLA